MKKVLLSLAVVAVLVAVSCGKKAEEAAVEAVDSTAVEAVDTTAVAVDTTAAAVDTTAAATEEAK